MKKILAAALASAFILTGCSSNADDATIVSANLSKAADNFEVNRRIVVFNGITDEILLTVTGACSIVDQGNQLEITCKIADTEEPEGYVKHFAGLSDNVSYFVEQGDPVDVSAYHYRVTFKPQSLIPDPDFRGSMSDGPRTQP